MGKHELKMDHALQKASPEEKAKAKAKALKGGMDPAAADKIFQMGSKGEFYMKPGHSNSKSMSELNMSNKDELMMKALYMHTGDPHPTDKLASYTETTTDVKRTGPSAASSNVQKSTSNLADYQSTLVDKGPDFKPTAAQTAAANAKVAELKKKDAEAKAFNESQSKSSPGSVIKSTQSVTKTVGEKTQKEILDKGTEFKSNYKSRIGAERKAAMDKSQGDSIKVAQDYLTKRSKIKPLTQKDVEFASRQGDTAGKKSLNEAIGSQGESLFSRDEASKLYSGESTYNRPNIKNFAKFSDKKKKRIGYRKTTGYTSTGQLGQTPKLSDLQMKPLKMSYYGNKKK